MAEIAETIPLSPEEIRVCGYYVISCYRKQNGDKHSTLLIRRVLGC